MVIRNRRGSRTISPLEPLDVCENRGRRTTEPVGAGLQRGNSYTSGMTETLSDTPLGLLPRELSPRDFSDLQSFTGSRYTSRHNTPRRKRDNSPFSCSSKSSSYRGRRPVSPKVPLKSPKRASTTFKRFLDVDVMKSITDLSCRPPKQVALRKALTRVTFYPLYYSYWTRLVSPQEWALSSIIYILEFLCCMVYIGLCNVPLLQDVPSSEVYFPPLLLVFIGLVFGKIPTASQKKAARKEKEVQAQEVLQEVETAEGESTEEESDDDDDDDDLLNNGFDSPKQQRRDDFLDAALDSSTTLDSSYSAMQLSCSIEEHDDDISVLVWGNQCLRRSGCSLQEILSRSTPATRSPFKLSVTPAEVREVILQRVEEETLKRPPSYDIPFWTALFFSILPTLHRIFMNDDVLTHFYSLGAAAPEIKFVDLQNGNASCVDSNASSVPSVLQVLATIFLHPSTSTVPLEQSAVPAFVALLSAVSVFVLVRKMVTHLTHAERTYHKRYLYAKFFSALTSLRRSQRYNLPHFRLKNVENVMAWLTLRGSRAWLRLEPQEIAADSVVSLTFQVFLAVVGLIGVIVLREGTERPKNVSVENFNEVLHAQVFMAAMVLSYYLVVHFMTTGTSINAKYGNSSLLLTEQLNIHLRMVAVVDKPNDTRTKVKKEKLLLTNKVLELAAKLLKELEGPNKISGLSMNPLLYNITRVMVLSCLSAAISHVVGFTPKLWKI
eukprot:TRINITY_DN1471_c1_g1_i1.p1 TRINITY_DN1471_c1_g1~~TRINITY_DN1471_c1_g1_i1.p1  ORF type:complete len:749 (+),score=191.56 TRINITY_DN1471_c1_g1_i1:85-2247(+)